MQISNGEIKQIIDAKDWVFICDAQLRKKTNIAIYCLAAGALLNNGKVVGLISLDFG